MYMLYIKHIPHKYDLPVPNVSNNYFFTSCIILFSMKLKFTVIQSNNLVKHNLGLKDTPGGPHSSKVL